MIERLLAPLVPTTPPAGYRRAPGRRTLTRLAALVAAGAVALAACGGGSSPGTASPSIPSEAPSGSPSGAIAPVGPATTSAPVPGSSGAAGGVTPGTAPGTAPSAPAAAATSPFPGGLLIADRGNGRILALDPTGKVIWRFPVAGSLPPGQRFSADDAFISADGKSIVANDEFHQVIDRIDIASRKLVWQYGHYGVAGSGKGSLHTPDDAYPLANGDIVVADIRNCRILEIAPDKSIVRQWGRTRVCTDRAPTTFGNPNGDTPLPDGGLLITEITGSRVVRLSADGKVVFDIHVPVAYPSDAQLDANGNVVVADFSTYGQVVAVNPTTGKLVWRYAPRTGPGRLDHPSLATPLPGGLVSINDDFRHRMIVIDPTTGRIVWQYGHADRPGRAAGYLNTPDGHQPLPVGTRL
ncbi:MAG: PQQ-binding-like beta-propeller repeat protein [Chloroflexota bacterium]